MCLGVDSPMQRRHGQHPTGPPGCDQDSTPAEQRPVRWPSGVGKPRSRPFVSHTRGTRIPGQCTCTGRGGAWKSPQTTNTGWVGEPAARWTTARNEELGLARQQSDTREGDAAAFKQQHDWPTASGWDDDRLHWVPGLCPSRTHTELLTYTTHTELCTFLQSPCPLPQRFI